MAIINPIATSKIKLNRVPASKPTKQIKLNHKTYTKPKRRQRKKEKEKIHQINKEQMAR